MSSIAVGDRLNERGRVLK